jgi:hypothetical protein
VLAGARQTGFYERNPWKRLERTLQLQFTITFGTEEEAREAAERINRVPPRHPRIDSVTGLPYDALDPDLLLWVHACLVDSSLLFERLMVGRLDDDGRERFHQEQMLGAELLGLSRNRIPPTVHDLQTYLRDVVDGGLLRVTPDARRVGELIRQPPPEVPWRPVLRQVAWWAFATLPPSLRQGYGVRWDRRTAFRLRGSMLSTKARPAVSCPGGSGRSCPPGWPRPASRARPSLVSAGRSRGVGMLARTMPEAPPPVPDLNWDPARARAFADRASDLVETFLRRLPKLPVSGRWSQQDVEKGRRRRHPRPPMGDEEIFDYLGNWSSTGRCTAAILGSWPT